MVGGVEKKLGVVQCSEKWGRARKVIKNCDNKVDISINGVTGG